ncbi:uncharacterized protein A1O5_12346 [Cladophialophora psammophila CBS 110553]|uniref:Thioesterase domain-containing protein n=1 Tax=Cladophialophora psammophila CBS 110553 TaxID=1182543 RepID=W9VQF2_9EURO|nr:uncharacterized protein A1O5_12346 [Cladophialophora psammophila CBS 110553]EXJ57788.1 hypothetical protein A1O5_12346 [Cladophialophora psammophila CBS 110553]
MYRRAEHFNWANRSNKPNQTRSREPKRDKEDEFFARTLATDAAISACVTQIRAADNESGERRFPSAPGSATWRPSVIEVRTLFAIAGGVNGYANIAHGGFVASILDEVMGILISTNKDRYEETVARTVTNGSTTPAQQKPPRLTTVTAELNVKYRKPVFTGGVVLVRAWFGKVQGPKLVVQATIEDADGRVLSEGTGLFVGLDSMRSHIFRGSWEAKI